MTTDLILIRHGETDWNIEGRYQGQAGLGLNSRGRAQALKAVASLSGIAVDAIYASDLERACETADIIARALRLPVTLDARLREIHQGDWQAVLYADIQAQYPTELQQFRSDPLHHAPPGGETLTALAVRVIAALEDISRQHPAQRVVIVTHKLPIALIRCVTEGRHACEVWNAIPGNAQSLRLRWHKDCSETIFQQWLAAAG